jgi:hypothetical protein
MLTESMGGANTSIDAKTSCRYRENVRQPTSLYVVFPRALTLWQTRMAKCRKPFSPLENAVPFCAEPTSRAFFLGDQQFAVLK